MASSFSRELGPLAKTVADPENGSTMPTQVLPMMSTVGEQMKTPQPRKEPTRGGSNLRREDTNNEAEFPSKNSGKPRSVKHRTVFDNEGA
jgi:hypothetical protein